MALSVIFLLGAQQKLSVWQLFCVKGYTVAYFLYCFPLLSFNRESAVQVYGCWETESGEK